MEEKISEMQRKDIRMALIYDIRLLVAAEEKDSFKKSEILNLLDTIAKNEERE